MIRSPSVLLLACAVTSMLPGCPKGAGSGDRIAVAARAPLRCAQLTREASRDTLEEAVWATCNAGVRFKLEPSGYQDLDLGPRLPSDAPEVARSIQGSRISERIVRLRDPAGENAWAVEISDKRLPWEDTGSCVRDAESRRFDLSSWRFLVVTVRVRDAFGTLRPLIEEQADTLSLQLVTAGGEEVQPALFPSTSHDGVWAAAWCAARGAPAEVEVDVRGAWQLETDRFPVPPTDANTYTVLDYVIQPLE